MAYTITEPSNSFLPSENFFWFSADSTDNTESSFTYRYRLQITGVDDTFTTGTTGADVVGTFRVPPRPITGEGYFSPMAISRNYVTTPLPLDLNFTQGATSDGVKKLRLIYGQEYVDSATGLTGMDSATGGTYYFWDGVLRDENFPTYSELDYVIQPYASGATSNTQFLTDGPDTRCIYNYDVLYTLVGPSGGFVRDIDDLITPDAARFFQTPSNFTDYWQEIIGQDTQGAGWTTIGGNGIQPDYTEIGTGEYSHYITTSPTPIGPVPEGSKIEIQLTTVTGWAGVATTNEMWMMGLRPGETEPVPIVKMDEYESGTATILYEVGLQGGDYYAPEDFDYIGFVWKNVGEASAPTIQTVAVWNIASKSAYWAVTPAGATAATKYAIDAYPTESRFAYLNVGTLGVGSANGFTVQITDVNDNPLSKIITYSNDDCNNCSSCEKKQLLWLNALGGYDSYEFNCLSGAGLSVTRSLGERTLPIGYQKGQRGRINPNNVAFVSRQVSTQYTGRDVTDWLESLLISPNVYEIQSDGTLIPVQIDTTTFSSFVTQDKLKVTEFSYTLGYTRKSQTL